jgi:hypothetical protein
MVTKDNKTNDMKIQKGFVFFSPFLSTLSVSFCKHESCKKLIPVMRPIHAGLEPSLFFKLSIGSVCKITKTHYSFVSNVH